MTTYQTTLLRSWREVEDLWPEWRALLPLTRADSIFLTPEWVQAWRGAMSGVELAPRVAAARASDGTLVGIAPFYRISERLAGVVPLDVLRVLGDYPGGAVYGDLIVHPSHDGAADALFAALLADRADAIWMPHTATWNGAAAQLRTLAKRHGQHISTRQHALYHFSLPDTYEAFEGALSKSTRKDFRRAARKLLDSGLTELARCESAAQVDGFVERLIDLNTRRWAGEKREGVFVRKPKEAEFYRLFAPIAQERGWLQFLELFHEGDVLATEVGYVYGNTYYCMQAGVDPNGPGGAGKVLLNEMIRCQIESGVAEFDFMTGDADYKKRYAASERTTEDLFIVRPSLKTLPIRVAGIWPRGRYLDFNDPARY